MTNRFLADVQLGPAWQRTVADDRSVFLRYGVGDTAVTIGARRSVDGWLRDAYPISLDDVELYTPDRVMHQTFTSAMAELSQSILAADPHCRRVVFAAAAGDDAVVSAARAAGFRYALDVDVPGAELSFLVVEADWVTISDADLDGVPGS